DRNRMPFFVMAELNPTLLGGQACWQGDVLWGREHENFDFLRNASWACRQITKEDFGKQLYAFSIGSPISFELIPPLKGRALAWVTGAARALSVLAILGLLVSVRLNQVLLPIGAAVSTLVTTTMLWPEYLIGFHTLEGGNDGLTHESLGFDIAQ